MSLCAQKEVSGEEWQCKAPFIEQQNYLLRQDGGLRSSGQAVVFVKEGCAPPQLPAAIKVI